MEEVFDDFIGGFWKNDRVTEMERLAAERGWEFNSRVKFSEQATDLKSFRLFHGKRGKRLIGIMCFREKSLRCDVRIYDYVYYSDGGKKKTTVIEMTCPELFLPKFEIKPKKGLASLFKFGKKKSSSGIERFNTHYILESPEPESIDIQIPDSVLELISECKELSVEGDGHTLLYYYYRKQIPVQDLSTEHALAMTIMDKLLHDREKEFV